MDPITLGFAAANAGMGIAKAFSGHSDATKKARAINQQRVQQYRNQLAVRDYQYKRDQGVYAQRLGQYQQQLGENQRAFSRAVGDTQFGLNETFRQAQVGQFQRAQQLAMKGGAAAAAGKTGSGLRSDQNMIGQYMQGQGMMMDNLLRARYGAQRQISGFRDQLISAQRRAYAPVSVAPMQPLDVPKPIQQSGPSNAGLMLGIGSSLLSGVSTYAGNVGAEGGVNLKSFGLD
jgi:hypothetical protein